MIRPYTPFLRFAKWPPAGGRCVCRAPAFTALCFLVNAVTGPLIPLLTPSGGGDDLQAVERNPPFLHLHSSLLIKG